MRRLAALLLFIAAPLWAQNPNGLPPCPKPDFSKAETVGVSGRTWHWTDCWGRYVFTQPGELRGVVIEGEWRYGELTGRGSYRVPNGTQYDGTFRNFRPHGQGQLLYRDGSRYDGEFRDGKRHGLGTYRYPNGDVYIGEFANGDRNGQGTYTFASGSSYTGGYKNNKEHGTGTYTSANGDKYVGELQDGQRHGQGSLFFANGDSYVGGFSNGKFHGQGIYFSANGQRREGQWDNGTWVKDSSKAAQEADARQALERERRQIDEERRQLEKERRDLETARRGDDPPPANDGAEKGYVSGSGFIMTPAGYIVTNYHVIEDTTQLTVRTTNGKTYAARIARIDEKNDLAVLKIDAAGLAFLPIADSSTVKKGTSVLAAGFPQIVVQGIEPKITDGIISSLTGIMNDARTFQMSNPIQPGNSGGPLFTLDGNVIGIVNAQLSAKTMQKEFDSIPQNVNFAVKSSYLLSLLREMRPLKLAPPNPKYRYRTTEDVVVAVEPALVLVIGK